NVSDVSVDLDPVGDWKEYRITLADLIDNGNSLAGGQASLAAIANIFVIDPSAAMDVSFDNIRIEGEEAEVIEEFAPLPLYTLYDDSLAIELQVQSYNPSGHITASEVTATDHGNVFHVVKTGPDGNVFFNVIAAPADLGNWSANGELVFDVRVNSRAVGAKLLVKMDSGWPNVSDVEVTLSPDGEWAEYRIAIADLIDNGNSNSCCPGAANLNAITNIFVIEPSAAMDLDIDNVRLVVEEEEFAPLPLFTLYEDTVATGLQVQSYNPSGQVSSSTVMDDVDHGNVFNVVKTGPDGNVFFNITAGPADLSHWAAGGKLKFDFKVNSKAVSTTLLIKMDSSWPNVSDVNVPLPADGVWTSYSIDIADLIDNGNSNSCCPGVANLAGLINAFVVEPSGAIDVSFDNIQFVDE
ncbi:MAG: hypothetical protein K0Q67_1634, partial [Cellvibrio sp.]|nr:hypothetical protein [Cellvibrio sp.]